MIALKNKPPSDSNVLILGFLGTRYSGKEALIESLSTRLALTLQIRTPQMDLTLTNIVFLYNASMLGY